MSRWKAAAIHVSISIAIGLLSAALIFGVWYPPPYSRATGALELVVLLMGIDLVLGPLITLVVFKSGKKGMRFDLCVIALLQTCALVYGMSVVMRARPVFIVGEIDRFVLVAASDLDKADIAQATQAEFRHLPWTGPRIVGAEIPTDTASRNALIFSGTAGKDIDKFPKYYVDYARVAAKLLKHAKPLDALRKRHPEATPLLESWLHKHPRNAADAVWLPLVAPRNDLTMLLDRHSGDTLGALPIDPW